MQTPSSIPDICNRLRVLAATASSESDARLDAKQKIIPPFFTDDKSVQIIHNFLKSDELVFYNNWSLQLYQFRSKHFQLFTKLGELEKGKYLPLVKVADMFTVIERACMEIQQHVFAQMVALEDKQYETFFLEWQTQQEINSRLDKFFEAHAEVIPFENPVLSIAKQKSEIKVALKRRGFARAAAIIAVTLSLFIQSLVPSALASSSSTSKPLELIRFNIPTQTNNVQQNQEIITHFVQAKTPQKEDIVTIEMCADFTKYWEGYKSVAYKDSLGYLTIGYGTCIDKRIKPDAAQIVSKFGLDYSRIVAGNQRVSQQVAQKLLESEIKVAHGYAFNAVNTFTQLDPYAQRCVVDMIYNLGYNGFLKFKKLISALERKDYATAAVEMKDSRWFNQTAKRAQHHVQIMCELAKKYPVQQQTAQQFRLAA